MSLIAWMYDVAREQSPREDRLMELLQRSVDAGYNAVGLYVEHRYAYASAPWAAAPGCVTPELVGRAIERFTPLGLRVIPFLNTLGHMEGFIRSEGGQWLAEGPPGRMFNLQICPSRPECVEFARGLVVDALATFTDEWVHVGGDEASQLGQCALCAEREKRIGKAGIYAEYYGPLCRWLVEQGRRPCLWGDMLLEHPEALDALPRETVIFDWQYFNRPLESARKFRERGFDVVCCPSLQTYNAGWCFLNESQRNIDEHAADARELAAHGVCVTTWEFSHFSEYESVLPLIFAAGRRLARGEEWDAALLAESDEAYAAAADILGNQIPAAAEFLKPGTWRQLRDRLVFRQNPFLLWRDWRDEACGPAGDAILKLCDQADDTRETGRDSIGPSRRYANRPLALPIELHRVAVLWVWLVAGAQRRYAAGDIAGAASELEAGHKILDRLRPGLQRVAQAGGSTGDVARLDLLHAKITGVVERLRALPPDGPFRPSFETLIHDAYVPGDQAAWKTKD